MSDISVRPSRSMLRQREIPGESGLWVFLFGDMAIFLVFFASYLVERARDPLLFQASRQSFGLTLGLVNTIILLTSSLLVVMAVNAARAGAKAIAVRALWAALFCGATFVTLKCVEYTHLISAGNGPGSNHYFTYFFILTGLHLMHVLIGFGTLGIMIAKARQPGEITSRNLSTLQSCACYWHLVDLLWMVIFPLLYLLG
ncbi:cytochrome C oxidase subunit III [Pararhizobium polonicum]|uniref:Cytochrome C oxidase subunit III n=1 Tax=Pararhizobium polonicum TaxID=1612624 RepID=A0A1C7NT39_9HYPH|nr:cytochrome c oxidase subunit 3 [Pararhizobium polonicum]OBZ92147.1 cytochrome C oxidase subunit III [Pararhizobium polonicum]